MAFLVQMAAEIGEQRPEISPGENILHGDMIGPRPYQACPQGVQTVVVEGKAMPGVFFQSALSDEDDGNMALAQHGHIFHRGPLRQLEAGGDLPGVLGRRHLGVGVVGGVMLALGRALGETMAVTFVIGNAHKVSPSLLAPGTTISATIANEFTEAVGDIYTSALIELGLILFLITFMVLAVARYMLMRLERTSA